MDPSIFIALIGTILSSGLVAGIVTFKLNASRDDRLFLQQRLEELHECFFEASRGLSAHWVPFIGAMTGHISYNQALDLTTAKTDATPLPIPRLQMLASIYHREYLPLVDRLIAIREDGNRVIHVHKARYKEVGPHQTRAAAEMRSISSRLGALEDEFLGRLRGANPQRKPALTSEQLIERG